jgi:hypothetical protein
MTVHVLMANSRRRRTTPRPKGHPSEEFLGFVWRPVRAAGKHPPRWQKSMTVVRGLRQDDAAFARTVDMHAERMRQAALEAAPGSRPRVVVHLSPSRTEAIIEVVVLWHTSSPTA